MLVCAHLHDAGCYRKLYLPQAAEHWASLTVLRNAHVVICHRRGLGGSTSGSLPGYVGD